MIFSSSSFLVRVLLFFFWAGGGSGGFQFPISNFFMRHLASLVFLLHALKCFQFAFLLITCIYFFSLITTNSYIA
jgi:hypothetical protein